MDLSIILVNYNTKDLTRNCLRTVFGSKTKFSYEVIVSDNGSKDGSIEMLKSEFPQVRLIENNANFGFSKGNNVGIKQAAGKYILLLNTDTVIKPDALENSVEYISTHPEIGALGAKVLLPDGSLDKACRRKFPNPANAFLRLFGFRQFSDYNVEGPIDEQVEVDALIGAYMMVPRSIIDKVGPLDEAYFMYGEELDWCWRIKEAGYKVLYYPKSEITHFKYGSSKDDPFRMIRAAHGAMKIFYRQHYAAEHSGFFNQFVYFGITLRMYWVILMNLVRRKKTVH